MAKKQSVVVANIDVRELERRLIEHLSRNSKGVPFLQLRVVLNIPMEHFKIFLQSLRKLEKSNTITMNFINGVRWIKRV